MLGANELGGWNARRRLHPPNDFEIQAEADGQRTKVGVNVNACAFFVSFVYGTLSCVFAAAGNLQAAQDQVRQWLPPPTLASSLEDLDGHLFGAPQVIKAGPDGSFLLGDWGDFKIRAFSSGGQPLWAAGGGGQGPGEFLGFWDMEYDSDGNLLVLDQRNRRLTLLDPGGSVVDMIPLPEERMTEILPSHWHAAHFALLPHDQNSAYWLAVSHEGHVHPQRGPTPARRFESPLITEGFATPLPDGGAALVFRWSSQIVIFDSGGAVRTISGGVEPIPFPTVVSYTPDSNSFEGFRIGRVTRIDPAAMPAARSVAAHAGRIFILFGGATDRAGRIIDTYTASDGSYLGSYLLPTRVQSIAILSDGRLATLDTSFIPTVSLWSLRG